MKCIRGDRERISCLKEITVFALLSHWFRARESTSCKDYYWKEFVVIR